MEFAIAKVSTKGQIVIPSSLRGDIHSGDEFLIVKDNGRMILKNMKKVAKDLKEESFIMQAGNLDFEGEKQRLPLVNIKRIAKIS